MKKWILLTSFSLIISIAMAQGSAVKAKTDIPLWKLHQLDSAIKAAEGPTIFNFWATFCAPCIAEIPYFQQLVKKYENEGVKLILVSLDFKENYPKKIEEMAQKRKFTAPIVFVDESNADLLCPTVDSTWSGVLPASLFVNPKTGYRSFFEEAMKKEAVEKEIRAMIGK